MRLTHLELTNHRNIAHAELNPDPHLTVLCGPNGQGKTNLLEAVWLLTGGKSFRGSKDAELIQRGCDFSVIEGTFETQDVEKSIRLTVGSKGSQRPGRTGRTWRYCWTVSQPGSTAARASSAAAYWL